MTPDVRRDVAVRLACAWVASGGEITDNGKFASRAVELTDQLLLALSPPSTPPAPEARPTHVRVTRAPKSSWCVTVGKVYPVSRYSHGEGPEIVADDGRDVYLSRTNGRDTDSMGYPAWEPATPPAPVEPAKERDALVAVLSALEFYALESNWEFVNLHKNRTPGETRGLFMPNDYADDSREMVHGLAARKALAIAKAAGLDAGSKS